MSVKKKPGNEQPVRLTSIVGKLLESSDVEEMYAFGKMRVDYGN